MTRDQPEPRLALAMDAIKNKDAALLSSLLTESPELVGLRDEDGWFLIDHTQSYANNARENPELWTAQECATVLLDAGSALPASALRRAIETGCTEMVNMFVARGAAPRNLRTLAVVGDVAAVDGCFGADGALEGVARPAASLLEGAEAGADWPPREDDALVIADALRFACRHGQAEVVATLADRALALDPELKARIDAGMGGEGLCKMLLEQVDDTAMSRHLPLRGLAHGAMLQAAIDAGNAGEFAQLLAEAPELLTREHEAWQEHLLSTCAYTNRPAIARALLDAGASVRNEPRPPSQATVYAIDYGNKEMIEILAPLWPPRDDLPTAAGLGRLESVKACFDAEGRLLQQRAHVYPEVRESEDPDAILLHALGLALMNQHLDVADFLLERGAPIDGRWGLHEPAGLLHEVAAHAKMDAIRFLIARGVDLTLRDDRYAATASGWAHHCGQEQAHALLLPPTIAADLITAVQSGTTEDLRQHLEAGADPNESLDCGGVHGLAPLFWAVASDSPGKVQLLLEHGASPRHEDSTGRGTLDRLAEDSANREAIERLLAAAQNGT